MTRALETRGCGFSDESPFGFQHHRAFGRESRRILSPSYVTVSTLSLSLSLSLSVDEKLHRRALLDHVSRRLILSRFVNLVKLVKSGSANVATRFTDARAIRDSGFHKIERNSDSDGELDLLSR